MNGFRRAAAGLVLISATTSGLSAFALFGGKWPNGTVAMHLQLGPSPQLVDGSASWGDSAESALSEWNQYLGALQFRVVRDSTVARGDGNGVNNVFFASEVYGRPFGSGVLAVTTTWSRRGVRTEGDVIFNSTNEWDSYSGTLRRGVQDFHRVALHEFGHVIGLDHPDENGQSFPAIMNSHISSLDRLTSDDIAGAAASYPTTPPGAGSVGTNSVSFPPRNEALDFRNQLETKYRDGLRRAGISTAVDAEGDIVWIQEYLRYRVNQCTHAQAIASVFAQIDGAVAPATCGAATTGAVLFPPRNEALDFRNRLETKYRDGLRRLPTSTSVDTEGDVVWTQEYLRYRVNGCGHAAAVQNVFAQIDGALPAPVCR